MPRPPGHGPDYERRRQEIIDRSAALFAERGYAATGTIDICTAVGLGKGALYHYIGSKERLLVEIQNRVLEPLLTEANEIKKMDAPAMVRIRLISHHLMRVILHRLDHIWVYEHDYRHLTGSNRTSVLRQRHEFEDVVRSLLEQAVEDGVFTLADPKLATLQFLNLHNHTYQWARPGMPWTAADLSATYYCTLMLGFGATEKAVRTAEARAQQLLREAA